MLQLAGQDQDGRCQLVLLQVFVFFLSGCAGSQAHFNILLSCYYTFIFQLENTFASRTTKRIIMYEPSAKSRSLATPDIYSPPFLFYGLFFYYNFIAIV